MRTLVHVRPMLDAPSFVHLSWLEHEPPRAAMRRRLPLAAGLSSLLQRIGQRLSGKTGAPWI